MVQITAKELNMISDALTYEGLICKKARMYSKTLTDASLAARMGKIADSHARRFGALLSVLEGK